MTIVFIRSPLFTAVGQVRAAYRPPQGWRLWGAGRDVFFGWRLFLSYCRVAGSFRTQPGAAADAGTSAPWVKSCDQSFVSVGIRRCRRVLPARLSLVRWAKEIKMNILTCPQCGHRATSFLKKILMGPLHNIACRSCGTHLGIPWWSPFLLASLWGLCDHLLSSFFDIKSHYFARIFLSLILIPTFYGLFTPLKRSYF